MNRFVSINFTRIILAHPGLQVVDVRGNVAFDCQISPGLNISIRGTCKSGSVISLPSLASSIQFLLPPTPTRLTHGMPFLSKPSQLPPTSTHGMSFLSTQFSGFYTTSIQNQTTTSTYAEKSRNYCYAGVYTYLYVQYGSASTGKGYST